MPLAIAMTSAPRHAPTLERALASLRGAGFHGDVQLFIEPRTFAKAAPIFDHVHLHENPHQLGCFNNWKKALEWLVRSSRAAWMLVLQDDAVWRTCGAEVLRAQMHASRNERVGLLSPYTSPAVVTDAFTNGWNECRAGWNFWGALAFCLKRDAAKELLQHPRFTKHVGTQVDAVVAASMLDLGWTSLVHVPSLVDHIGTTSTIGRDDDPAWGRRGYRFDED